VIGIAFIIASEQIGSSAKRGSITDSGYVGDLPAQDHVRGSRQAKNLSRDCDDGRVVSARVISKGSKFPDLQN